MIHIMRNLWQLFLSVALSTASPAVMHATDVCNAGFPGENSVQVLQRLPKALVECDSLYAVVIFVGMNDAVNEKQFLTPDLTVEAVNQMLRLIKAAHTKAFVVSMHDPDEVRLMYRLEHSVG